MNLIIDKRKATQSWKQITNIPPEKMKLWIEQYEQKIIFERKQLIRKNRLDKLNKLDYEGEFL